jgi:hypothetical protein
MRRLKAIGSVTFLAATALSLVTAHRAGAEPGDCTGTTCTPAINLYVSSISAVSWSNERLAITLVNGQGTVYNVCNGSGSAYPAEVIVPYLDKEHHTYVELAKTALTTGKPVRVRAKANVAFFGIGSNACQLQALTLLQGS